MKAKLGLTCLLLVLTLNLIAAAVPFRDGEKLTFTVKYGIVSAGEASLQARSSVYQGSPVWYLSTTAKTYPFFDKVYKVRDRVESWWDKDTLLPYKFSKNLQEGNYRQHRVHIYNHQEKSSTYQKWSFKKSVFENTEMVIPEGTQDILSAFYLMRTKKLEVGKSVMVNITADGRNMPTEVVVHRKEKQKTIFGNVECLVIEPKLKGEAIFKQSGRILIWLTNDDYKIPVRLESKITIGSFVATLTSAQQVPFKIQL
ncbi:MAG TPA: DUF3108 domain-containing protein [Candidatus Cloacimonas sp.]|nr:DUF3108 domain-containing protein [Candidatus Cloacimonas sp.]MDD2250272.1 DUF3108 domain-containing protein [Candidatus Cloacimonadota bacterium]MCK9158183.1 DUF3108 domain-containing protein [Candidatus Cloacimonas sp.]MCK9164986.1 DUF3108 domain-containing protein [Candidatus Cloacimonas sp.]MDD3734338.1 DUF3108 domain-containing protein [Candidatus Cloacimonadota bacterium]